MEDVLFGLNEQQRLIAQHTDGPILVTAGAGSGKTRLLTHRICYLIENGKAAPENILAITFTNKATNEMRERIEKMLPEGKNVWISTFHSMCVKILRQNISFLDGYTKYFTICDEADKDKLIKGIIKEKNITEGDFKNTLLWHISNSKNKGLSPKEYANEILNLSDSDIIIDCYKRYEEELKRSNTLDFDDLLVKTYELFYKVPHVLEYYQNKFKYIHVDEFQDTNVIQYKLVQMLCGKHNNIFVVGDEDQCIYCWRGANIKNIKNFISDFNNTAIYKLEQNYRSTKNIINTANMLIKNNVERIDKTLFTENDEGDLITYYEAGNENDEAEYVAKRASLLIDKGVKPSEIGILMRISGLSRLFEEKLLNYNIPYVVSGIFKFFDRAEIKNLLAYLRVIVNNSDNISLLRIINFPKRSIGNATIDKLVEYSREKNISLFETITNFQVLDYPSSIKTKIADFAYLLTNLKENSEKMPITEFVKYLISSAKIKESYNKNNEDDMDRLVNIDQFIQSIQSFENLNDDSSILNYLESVTLQNSIEEENVEDCVSISTVHASKGLEFDIVFVVGLEEGCFPLSRCGGRIENLEEERRLMYVAATRARKQLFVTRAKSRFLYGNRDLTIQSRFIKEMDLKKPFGENYSSFGTGVNTSYKSELIDPKKKFESSNASNLWENKVIKSNQSKFVEYKIGSQVLHTKFGVGIITSISGSGDNTTVSVNFKGFGVKQLSLAFAPLKIIK